MNILYTSLVTTQRQGYTRAESNVWADPEAAQIVFQSGAPITMIGWELVWGDMLISGEEMAGLRTSHSCFARFTIDCSRKVVNVVDKIVGYPCLPLPDVIAMAIVIDPSICSTRFLYVEVETDSELTRGETIVDQWGVMGKPPNVRVCFKPDAQKYKRLLFGLLKVD